MFAIAGPAADMAVLARPKPRAYRETQSDLLVMGAYSRHRLRQLVFGGVTQHMLFKADIPALMLHR